MPATPTLEWHDPVYENDKEALLVLDLIVTEFESDPMSVQCFDLRVVRRAKDCIAQRMRQERMRDAAPLLTKGPRK